MKPLIGVFDSGLGGLTVLKEILNLIPNCPLIYFGDTARVPYGSKSKETVIRFSIENTDLLKSYNIGLLVVACHTASSLALDQVQEKAQLPTFGVVEPSIVKAIEQTTHGRIGIIGTKSTVSSNAFETAILSRDPNIQVYSQACPLFVPLVEEGWTKGSIAQSIIRQYLQTLVDQNIDTLILGCTHYPLLLESIQDFLPSHIRIINPAYEVALAVKNIFSKKTGMGVEKHQMNQVQYLVSDAPEHFKELGQKFLGHPINKVELVQEKDYSLL